MKLSSRLTMVSDVGGWRRGFFDGYSEEHDGVTWTDFNFLENTLNRIGELTSARWQVACLSSKIKIPTSRLRNSKMSSIVNKKLVCGFDAVAKCLETYELARAIIQHTCHPFRLRPNLNLVSSSLSLSLSFATITFCLFVEPPVACVSALLFPVARLSLPPSLLLTDNG